MEDEKLLKLKLKYIELCEVANKVKLLHTPYAYGIAEKMSLFEDIIDILDLDFSDLKY